MVPKRCANILRIGLKIALLVCFLIALGNAIRQLANMETIISIAYERETPLPSVTVCNYPIQEVEDLSKLTLVDYFQSNLSLTENDIVALYIKLDISPRANPRDALDSMAFERLPLEKLVTVNNGFLAKCFTFNSTKQFLDTRLGTVTT